MLGGGGDYMICEFDYRYTCRNGYDGGSGLIDEIGEQKNTTRYIYRGTAW